MHPLHAGSSVGIETPATTIPSMPAAFKRTANADWPVATRSISISIEGTITPPSGDDALAAYQQALESITFSTSSTSFLDRTVDFVVTDPFADSNDIQSLCPVPDQRLRQPDHQHQQSDLAVTDHDHR